jgi:hypothetical protein
MGEKIRDGHDLPSLAFLADGSVSKAVIQPRDVKIAARVKRSCARIIALPDDHCGIDPDSDSSKVSRAAHSSGVRHSPFHRRAGPTGRERGCPACRLADR